VASLFSSFGFFGLSDEPTVQRSPDNLTLAVDYTRARTSKLLLTGVGVEKVTEISS
jgi:hypothetical protein